MDKERSVQGEVPGSSSKKKRGPQTRDYIAARLESTGSGLGSGRTYERCDRVVQRADELRSQGYLKEADILVDALNISKRGTYEISKLPQEHLLAFCQIVMAGEARNLIEARKLVIELMRQEKGAEEDPVTLEREKNGMYRIRSLHNHSSVLVSAKDLLSLTTLLVSLLPELEEQAQ